MDLFRNQTHPSGTLPFRTFSRDGVYNIAVGTTSKGEQQKYKSIDSAFYIKSRFIYQQRLWRDDFVEVIASQYAGLCNLPDEVTVVRQGLCKVGREECSYSEAFDLNGDYYIPFSRALQGDFNILSAESIRVKDLSSWFSILRDYYSKVINMDATGYLVTMMLLDVIVANEDRHLSNFGYVMSESSGNLLPSPLFDFGLGLFEHSTDYYNGIPFDRALKKVKVKPWGHKLLTVLAYLENNHSSLVSRVLPESVNIETFNFPSQLAKEYFQWVNERLGVRVVSL